MFYIPFAKRNTRTSFNKIKGIKTALSLIIPTQNELIVLFVCESIFLGFGY